MWLGNGTLEIEGPSPKGRRREGSVFWVSVSWILFKVLESGFRVWGRGTEEL